MTTDVSLTSLDIAELVRNQHENVMRTIRTLASAGAIQPPLIGETEKTSPFGQRKEISHYVFAGKEGKRDSIVVAAQLLPNSTGVLFDRWQELEAKVKESERINQEPEPKVKAPEHEGRVTERVSILGENKTILSGISLRDYFAAAALQGLLACIGTGPEAVNPLTYFSKRSYQYADAMLAVKNQREH